MRRLLLMRHAHTDRSLPGASDQDRPLSARGRAEAHRLGLYMARHALVPDRVIVSSAMRARETWELVAAAFPAPPPANHEARVYQAAPQDILDVIKECAPSTRALLLIGHNPALQELAVLLIATGEVEARQHLKEDFPTAGLAIIDFAVDDWSRLHPHAGRLDRFVSPDLLATTTD